MFSTAPMEASDAIEIERQHSQRVQLGLARTVTVEEAEDLATGGQAWTVRWGGRIVACIGLRETFPPVQGVAWAILATDIGPAHLALTRFARRCIEQSKLVRIEALVRANVHAEVAWAQLAGLEAVCVLRKFGALSETHVLFERVR